MRLPAGPLKRNQQTSACNHHPSRRFSSRANSYPGAPCDRAVSYVQKDAPSNTSNAARFNSLQNTSTPNHAASCCDWHPVSPFPHLSVPCHALLNLVKSICSRKPVPKAQYYPTHAGVKPSHLLFFFLLNVRATHLPSRHELEGHMTPYACKCPHVPPFSTPRVHRHPRVFLHVLGARASTPRQFDKYACCWGVGHPGN